MSHGNVYFLAGRGGSLDSFRGVLSLAAGASLRGRTADELAPLRFNAQLAVIRADLIAECWHPHALLIGNSYGAYLLMHTLVDLVAFPGVVLLFSPVLGGATSRDGRYASRPPRAERLLQLAESGGIAPPRHLEIHIGAEDRDCDPERAARFASLLGNGSCTVVLGERHRLPSEYVGAVIERSIARLGSAGSSPYAAPAEGDIVAPGRSPREDPGEVVMAQKVLRATPAKGTCPKCGHAEVWRVMYGRPGPGARSAPRTISGGCCIGVGSPDSYCPNCRVRWRERDVVRGFA